MAAPLKCIRLSNSAKHLACKHSTSGHNSINFVVPVGCLHNYRSLSQLSRATKQFSKLQHKIQLTRLEPFVGICGSVRCNSSVASGGPVGDPMTDMALEQMAPILEPTFESLGLGGWTPIGLVQQSLEFLHITCGLPWWGSIVVGTLAIKLCLLPLQIAQNKQAYKIITKNTEIEEMICLREYERSTENRQGVKEQTHKLKALTVTTLSPTKLCLPTALQVPILLSVLPALYQMAQVPIESMKTGGMFFTPDLTITDETMVLPVMVGVIMWHYVKDGAPISTCLMILKQNYWSKLLLMPCFATVVMMFYSPSALTLYLLTSSIYNFSLYYLLRSASVRTMLKFPPDVQHPIKGYKWKRPHID